MPKVRRKPGYSQLHWMTLLAEAEDLTDGVGVANPGDERSWTSEEVATHCTVSDCWISLGGKVYNVTRYLPYHPGSEEELMRAAGRDGTVLFERIHPWVNADAMLKPCCVGWLAPMVAAHGGDCSGDAVDSARTSQRSPEPQKRT